MNILGYYEDDNNQPIAFMNTKGIIVFSNEKKIKENKKLGGIKELHNILSNLDYYKRISNRQTGAGGFFGESYGKCGWGDGPSCCFFSCEPLWRTSLWPFSNTSM